MIPRYGLLKKSNWQMRKKRSVFVNVCFANDPVTNNLKEAKEKSNGLT